MPAQVVDRGRGPEIVGTRVTVYRIMDYLRENATPSRIATELELTDEQVQAALEYIDGHRQSVEAGYQAILRRLARERASAPREAVDVAELKQRILSRKGQGAVDAGPSRQ